MAKNRLNQLKKEVAERVRDILLEKDWYQQQLVDEIGTTKSHISEILNGNVNLTLETIAKMEQALGKEIIQVVKKK